MGSPISGGSSPWYGGTTPIFIGGYDPTNPTESGFPPNTPPINPKDDWGIIVPPPISIYEPSELLLQMTKTNQLGLPDFGNMTEDKIRKLDEALHKLTDNSPIMLAIVRFLISKNHKLNWSISQSSTAAATYGINKTIKFSESNGIQAYNLVEELIHAFQHAYYGEAMENIANIALNPTRRGMSNIEFEAKLLIDIISNNNGIYRLDATIDNDAFTMFGFNDYNINEGETACFFRKPTPEEFVRYLNKVRRTVVVNSSPNTPKNMAHLGGNIEYMSMLQIFVDSNPSYPNLYGSPKDETFLPNAMLFIFQITNSNYRSINP